MSTIVQKYGGTSIDCRDKILGVAERVASLRRDGHDVVVVVSARGATTDALLEEARAISRSPSQRELDMLMTAGERISMSLLAMALNSIGCPAVSFTGSQVGIITDTRHTDARILEVRPHRVIDELEAGNVVVVGGFQGVSTAKEVTTLGRGGSDTTAVALAAALGAERCEILTDVDGVYTADPRAVPRARKINEIRYEDMCELARFGATVLKEDAVRFAERSGIAIHVAKSDGAASGTIVLGEPSGTESAVVGLALLKGIDLISWKGVPLAACAPVLERLGGACRAVTSFGGATLAAVQRSAVPKELPVDLVGETATKAHLICAAGPGAGSPATARAVVETAASLGEQPLMVISGGRSTVLAVRPFSSEEVLRSLHEELLEPAEAA